MNDAPRFTHLRADRRPGNGCGLATHTRRGDSTHTPGFQNVAL